MIYWVSLSLPKHFSMLELSVAGLNQMIEGSEAQNPASQPFSPGQRFTLA